jgi:hypothetical protein
MRRDTQSPTLSHKGVFVVLVLEQFRAIGRQPLAPAPYGPDILWVILQAGSALERTAKALRLVPSHKSRNIIHHKSYSVMEHASNRDMLNLPRHDRRLNAAASI